MKCLVIAVLATLAIYAQATTDEQKAKFKELYEGCVSSTQVDKELLAKARKSEYTGRDEKLKNYFHCMTTKLAFQRDDGTFDIEKMTEHLPETVNRETGIKGLKKCGETDDKATPADRSMDFVYCFYKTMGKDVKLY